MGAQGRFTWVRSQAAPGEQSCGSGRVSSTEPKQARSVGRRERPSGSHERKPRGRGGRPLVLRARSQRCPFGLPLLCLHPGVGSIDGAARRGPGGGPEAFFSCRRGGQRGSCLWSGRQETAPGEERPGSEEGKGRLPGGRETRESPAEGRRALSRLTRDLNPGPSD